MERPELGAVLEASEWASTFLGVDYTAIRPFFSSKRRALRDGSSSQHPLLPCLQALLPLCVKSLAAATRPLWAVLHLASLPAALNLL